MPSIHKFQMCCRVSFALLAKSPQLKYSRIDSQTSTLKTLTLTLREKLRVYQIILQADTDLLKRVPINRFDSKAGSRAPRAMIWPTASVRDRRG